LARDLSLRLAGRISRRSLVVRAGVAGAALTVAPIRYLLRPDSAFADAKIPCKCGGNDCNLGRKCCDGYTEFCVTLTNQNVCPPDTFIGGWWKCKTYTGSQFCNSAGKRYYYDCHANHDSDWTCHCASAECDCRAVAANHVRYGQCNKQIKKTTAIVCRIVTCQPPWKIRYLYQQCSKNVKHDHATCAHEPCHGW
jgi:hypothetical protein